MKKVLYLLTALLFVQATRSQSIQTTLNTLGGKSTVNNFSIEWSMGNNFSLTIGNGPYITQGILQPSGSAAGVLPVSLSAFVASRKTTNTVQLNWETATESNNTGFAVERKREGEAGFTKIGFVATNAIGGNSNQLNRYTYMDNNNNNTLSYYRLQQIDRDGHTTYSAVRAVAGNVSGLMIRVYPNPVVDNIVIEYNGLKPGLIRCSITDMGGRLLQEWTAPSHALKSVKDLSALAAGTYMLVIRQDGMKVGSQKLMKR
jgi:hypothetical protein